LLALAATIAAGVVTLTEYALPKRSKELRDIVIQVDDFPLNSGK
jgi:hypothetical protein